jgi:hypothetical protein
MASLWRWHKSMLPLTILNENIQTGLNQQCRIEYDETKTQRQDIIARPDLEETTNLSL